MELILQQLAAKLKLVYQGDGDTPISGVASFKSATAGDLCFIQHGKYLDDLARSSCSAVIVPPNLAGEVSGKALLVSANPQYDFVRAVDLLGAGRQALSAGVHPTAQVAASARIGRGVSIGALTTIADDVDIGAGTSIGSGVSIASSVRIGKRCHIHGRVTLEQGVVLGDRCILHPGAVIGCDGFGLVMHRRRWHKIPQLGGVRIGDDVEIGANTTIDRGALDDTIIEQGCKLDNQIQIAHNVHIGAHTAVAACVGIAGSAVIGRYCKISGAAVVLGHLRVVDNVTITAMSLVTKDIREPGVYSSGTPLMENGLWHRSNARYKSLEKLAQSVARLEKAIK